MKTKYLLLCALSSALLFACNAKPDPSSQNDTTQISKEPVDTALATNPNMDNFAEKAAIGGMMEVESSAKMIKFTENPDIQTLAAMMVKDHTAANNELKEIAKREKLNLPQTLPSDKMEKLNHISTLKEEEANRYYADLMVKEHQEAVALFTAASENESNAALKAFAVKHLPILKAHAAHAETVNKMIQSIKNDKGDVPLKLSKDRAN
ncbi:DUF4142 domain-containing protein [Pedobacter boryungensis]|uniref:DUF4142 domain-containing protein n=1 Tax=Pedobacter boryungensis TaxID=869962 RepID=A0ABX2DB42_9SPHI|nr:DUF4142 domain-containing protein [Pedobacter boryungensis]NQX31057.1 DUF4142 domain-containing protein [Pedobacter boryungensis]